MAQLKDSVVSGSLRVTDTIFTTGIQTNIIKAPTASNGTTYGPGTNGQILKSNGTSVYWTSDNNSDVNVKQLAAITTAGAYPVILANSTATTEVTGTVNKSANLTYNPNTKALSTGGTINGLTLTAASTGFTIAGGTTSKTLTVNNTYTLGAACAKGVTDNSSSTAVTSTDTNLITARTLYYAGYTKNAGTITGITMNGVSKGTSGVVDLGTVITAHQDISGKLDKNQGSENAGKAMVVGSTGVLVPTSISPTTLSLTVAAGSWSSATPPTQTLTAIGVTASNNIIVSIASNVTAEQYDEACMARIVCTAQATDSLTFTCYGIEPTVNIPVSVIIMG